MQFTVTYSGADFIALSAADVTLIRTGTANGTVSVTNAGAVSRTVTICCVTGDGALSISLPAGTGSDAAGNPAPAAGPSAEVAVGSPPRVFISSPSVSVTRTGPVFYVATYGGADDITLSPADITLNKAGTADGTVSVSGTGTATRTVTISDITGEGMLGISIAAGSASDLAGNAALAAGPSSTFTVDRAVPSITIASPTSDPTCARNCSTLTIAGAASDDTGVANVSW